MICMLRVWTGKALVCCVWKAKSADFDMQLFNDGDYLRAMEQNALAEAITRCCIRG